MLSARCVALDQMTSPTGRLPKGRSPPPGSHCFKGMPMSVIQQRSILLASAFAATSLRAGRSVAQTAPGPFTLPPLPYAPNANEPFIDAMTMSLHHDKHHAAYVTNLNEALKD